MRSARSIAGLAAFAAVAAMGMGSNTIALKTQDDDFPEPRLDPRRSAHRKGRRFNYGRDFPTPRNGVNPPGTKLAKKAAKGTLTLNALK